VFKFNRSIISSAVLSIVMSALVVLSVVSGNAKMPLSSRNFYSIICLIRSQLDNVPNTEENVIQTAVGSICTDELDDLLIRVYDSNEKRVKEMFLEDYIMGVVYAEMNLRNNIEALKAQAVAARSYTLYKFYNDGEGVNIHKDGAVICTDYTHCQAWKDPEGIIPAYGKETGQELYSKLKKAVESTKGIVMTYEGEVIKAMYFSSSGGYTESMEDVWYEKLAYLKSVPSYGELANDYYCNFAYFSKSDFAARFRKAYGDNFKAEPYNVLESITSIERSPTGRVKKITIGGVEMSGIAARSILGLRSTNMIFREFNKDTILVITIGTGHGVGMSQLGAITMADEGKTYDEILKHYYSGVELERELYTSIGLPSN
jgi:stage II sporulation protein D